MVSFFGLKLGSDRKKAQSKQAQSKAPQKWNRADQNALGEGQYFGKTLSPPQFPSSNARPGTANSTRSMSNWRAVFKNPAMTSSMTDLAPPRRRPSVGSLRHAASDVNLRPGTALPTALGGSGLRPGTPSRPSGAQKAGWVNPLDVHFCKNSANTHPGTPLGQNLVATGSAAPGFPNHPTGQFDFGQHTDGHETSKNTNKDVPSATSHSRKSDEVIVTPTQYPSPPPPDTNSEGTLSPVNVPAPDSHSPISKRDAPGPLGNVDGPEPTSPPSPMPTAQPTSPDRPGGPVVRNLPAWRDTFAFHQPRRHSFTKEFEEVYRVTMMHPLKEGFSGNFADFDFGESVTRTTSNTSETEQGPSLEAARRPKSISSSSITQTEREESRRPAPTCTPEDLATNVLDQLPRAPREHALRILGPPPAAAGAYRGHSNGTGMGFRQGFKSRFDSETWSRATPPRPLQPVLPPSATDDVETAAMNSCGLAPDSGIGCTSSEPTPRQNEKLPSSPFSRPGMEGNFPMSKGLPRGRRPGPLPPRRSSSDDDDNALPFPMWSDFDRSEPRLSAMPAPLTPSRPSPSQDPRAGLSTSTSATAPRVPSPTFPSLAKSIPNSSDSFGTSLDINLNEPVGSPTRSGFPSLDRRPSTSVGTSCIRVEAKKAPPRPAPVTLPPSPNKGMHADLRSPVLTEFTGTFI
ncbi:hypothetical protein J3459_014083 [Metarhizium acridum]|uniref:uncharacterized protein n=1 Tax=Metarhizium acridum TaxID=92637 RepID=UPI001C6AE2CC|nr:hypothetical protein J3458_020960 [Metarhizium acridum]KAG8414758.1 hypothetical protein J3459_014083 [Metarhizium acridum]